MKKRPPGSFAERLTTLRRSHGLTQRELGEQIGATQRVIAHYETGLSEQPASHLVVRLAEALHVSTDELLGLKPTREATDRKRARLRKRLQKVEELPPADQRTVLKLIDGLLAAQSANSHAEASAGVSERGQAKRSSTKQRATAKRTKKRA